MLTIPELSYITPPLSTPFSYHTYALYSVHGLNCRRIYMEQFSPNIYPLRAENNNVVCVHDQFHKLFNYYGHILIRVSKIRYILPAVHG